MKIKSAPGRMLEVKAARTHEVSALLDLDMQILKEGRQCARSFGTGGPDGHACYIAFVPEDEWPLYERKLRELRRA